LIADGLFILLSATPLLRHERRCHAAMPLADAMPRDALRDMPPLR